MPSLDVTANLFLGRELTRAGVLDRPAMRRSARTRLEAVGVEIDVDQPVGELSVGRRQIVAIAKALTYASRILIMDEPTAALTAAEVERLFKVMREIAGRGVGIVYISHRLEEVPRVADRVTVHARRSGRRRSAPARAPQSQLVRLLVGRPLDELYPRRGDEIRQAGASPRACALRAAKARAPAGRRRNDVSLEVRAGEIVGLAGIMGAGRTELLTALYGAAGAGSWSGRGRNRRRARAPRPRSGMRAGRGLASSPTTGAAAACMLRDTSGATVVDVGARARSRRCSSCPRRESDALARKAIRSFDVRPRVAGDRCRRIVGRQPAESRARQGSASAILACCCLTSRRAASMSARRAKSMPGFASWRGKGIGVLDRVERDAGALGPMRPRRRPASAAGQ